MEVDIHVEIPCSAMIRPHKMDCSCDLDIKRFLHWHVSAEQKLDKSPHDSRTVYLEPGK